MLTNASWWTHRCSGRSRLLAEKGLVASAAASRPPAAAAATVIRMRVLAMLQIQAEVAEGIINIVVIIIITLCTNV
jgi:hypothetical protein